MEGDLITSGSLDSICRRHADLLEAYHKASQKFNQQADAAGEAEVVQLARQLSYLLNHMET